MGGWVTRSGARRWRGTVALLAAFSSSGIVAVITAMPAQASTRRVGIRTCSATTVVEPRSFLIYCADGNGELEQLSWQRWGATSAAGSGKYVYNTCTPTCAAGKDVTTTATAALSDPKATKYGELFSELRVTYKVGKRQTSFSFALIT